MKDHSLSVNIRQVFPNFYYTELGKDTVVQTSETSVVGVATSEHNDTININIIAHTIIIFARKT